MPYLLIFSAPTASVLAALFCHARPPSPVVAGVGLATVILVSVDVPALWLVAALAAAALTFRAWERRTAIALGIAGFALVLGYAVVWSGNYLVASLVTIDRLLDPTLRDLDLQVFRFAGYSSYDGIFPMVRHAWAFVMLERAYAFLFAEVVLVAMLWAHQSEAAVTRWLAVLFAAYAIGLVTFLALPAVGPPIAYPASFDSAGLTETWTFRVMQRMAVEFEQVQRGGLLTGFGYLAPPFQACM